MILCPVSFENILKILCIPQTLRACLENQTRLHFVPLWWSTKLCSNPKQNWKKNIDEVDLNISYMFTSIISSLSYSFYQKRVRICVRTFCILYKCNEICLNQTIMMYPGSIRSILIHILHAFPVKRDMNYYFSLFSKGLETVLILFAQ